MPSNVQAGGGGASQPAVPNRPHHGEFIWHELLTRDDSKAVAFFEELLGWRHVKLGLPSAGGIVYNLMKRGERTVAGAFKMLAPQFPEDLAPHWLSYIAVDDVDQRHALAVKLGARSLHPPTDVPDLGRIAIIKDPTGATVALVTPVGGATTA